MPTDSAVNVFSYGSNMCLPRIEERIGSVKTVAIGFVEQRRLVFHKRSIDGSAKADALLVDSVAETVWGVVYQIPAKQKRKLDEFEFLGIGYDQVQVKVRDGKKSTVAWMYVARTESVDSTLTPYSWYRTLILHGAKHHELPKHYVERIRTTPAVDDPDMERHLRNLKLVTPQLP